MELFAQILRSDRRGAALVEFALISPILITMLLGVVQIGTWVQAYNSVRNVVNDTTRFAMVEYQRGNKISDEAIADRASAIAVSGKYNLDAGLVIPAVTTKSTEVDGIKQRRLVISYKAPEFMPFVSALSPNIQYGRDIYLYDKSAVAGST
ncbi:TadE/TadG family type IV pilus assembly protein [Parafrankia sp. BMG5.11]|uniref:TadE/TadG family type IV pilus assembly protein n=1 Tax=Parafrankia sp. BMG5.11 TaxID=222540 RepID=UPI00103C59B9|nr:TadE family protein [Parafrankia sp. BMG5.11]TCJ32287.1 pilus assembly protein [Parafrankia sp. BMG5.11]